MRPLESRAYMRLWLLCDATVFYLFPATMFLFMPATHNRSRERLPTFTELTRQSGQIRLTN